MLRAILICLALLLPVSAAAQERDPEIEAVIVGQMQAFRDDDMAAAFAFAAPGIQGMFGTPENFGLMVGQGYPMVRDPGEVTFGPLEIEDGLLWQRVYVRDAAGRRHALAYQMQDMGGAWRIGGVRILPSEDVSA